MSLFKKLTKLERVNENIDTKQKSVDQLGATENPRKIKVLDTDKAPAHPFDGKLVGEESEKKSLRTPKDNPCWKGYKPVGTKKKAGRTVPNCVPKESVNESPKEYWILVDLKPGEPKSTVGPIRYSHALDADDAIKNVISYVKRNLGYRVAGARIVDKDVVVEGYTGADDTDTVGFYLDSERAYEAVMSRYGDHIDHDETSGIMYAPARIWPQIEMTAFDADGVGATRDDDLENPEHYGVAEGEHPKTWHDVDPKLGKQVDKMSQAEKVSKGFAHSDTLKKKTSFVQKLSARLQQLGYTQTQEGNVYRWIGSNGTFVEVEPNTEDPGWYGWAEGQVTKSGKLNYGDSGNDSAKDIVAIFKSGGVFRKQGVAEGVEIVDQDSDLDQQVFTLNVDGKTVSFTYWDYENNFQNPDIKDIYQQAREQLGKKLSPEQIKSVARSVFKSFKQGVAEAERNEMDTPEFQRALASLKKSAAQGPKKTVYDPKTGRYRVVPVNDPKKDPLKESYKLTYEEILSNLKAKLGDYLGDVARAIKDTDLGDKSTRDSDRVGAVKTVTTDDGHEIRIHGNEDDGFRVTIKNKDSKAKFSSLKEAEIAAEMYCARRRTKPSVPNDYESEK